MAYILAMMVGLGSFGLYLSAFFFPEVHRKYDLVWSGVGLFYALVLWVCAGRITGGVLLGQMSSVALLGWFGWQNLQLRRDRTPPDQQTQLPDSIQSADDVVKVGGQRLKSLFNRTAQPATANPSATVAKEPAAESTSKQARADRKSPRPAKTDESAQKATVKPAASERATQQRNLKKPAAEPAASDIKPDVKTEVSSHSPNQNGAKQGPKAPVINAHSEAAIPSTAAPESQEWDDGGEWETAELPLEDALGRFSPEVLNSLLEDTPDEEQPVQEPDPIYLKAELLSEPKEPSTPSRSTRRRGRRSRSTSARQLDIPSPYSTEDERDNDAIAFGDASATPSSRSPEPRSPRRRRYTRPLSDRELFPTAGTAFEEPWEEAEPTTPNTPLVDRQGDASKSQEDDPETGAEVLTAPGNLDSNPAASTHKSLDSDGDDWF